jgi:hypothetical protein
VSNWQKIIIWIVTVGCLLTLIFLSFYLYTNIEWFKKDSINSSIIEVNQGGYRTYIYHLQISLITRSIGLFSGCAIAFLGLASIFYTWSKSDNINIEASNVKAIITSASPGLLSLMIGGAILIFTISSKDDFPIYIPSYEMGYSDSSDTNSDTCKLLGVDSTINLKK